MAKVIFTNDIYACVINKYDKYQFGHLNNKPYIHCFKSVMVHQN